jgi:hypothetical protein
LLPLGKRLSEHFANVPEARIPEDIQEAWAGYFQEMAISQKEIDLVGLWYSRHYVAADRKLTQVFHCSCSIFEQENTGCWRRCDFDPGAGVN